jgi:drug/metabolite transporter (DMT)-like permease
MRRGVQMKTGTRRLSFAEGTIAGITFGTASIFVRLLGVLDTFSIAFWRMIVACAILLIVVFVLQKSFNISLVKKNLRELFILSLLLGMHFIFFVSAVKDTTVLNATALVSAAPLFSVFISSFVFKLRPSATAIVGLVFSLIGVCVIGLAEAAASSMHSSAHFPTLKGDLEAILAAVTIAIYLNYGKKMRSKMSLLSTMLPTYALTAVVIGLVSVLAGSIVKAVPAELGLILPLVGLGLLPTAIAHTLEFSSLSNLKPFETANMALLEPVGATILAAIVFQEVPGPIFVAGAAMVSAGVLFIGKGKS